ncbi:hypothetical protein [Peribacillus acanthi]|uniref:hypothetical protein n=1 Tax=Peribacillus acanthi TaxID=2171554 RepID=UPI000D3ECD13|nr:hypothetical protein [Peribacillus acanthi]
MATIKQYVLLFIMSIAIGLIAGFYSIPFQTLIPILIIMVALIFSIPLINHLYVTKNIGSVEKFLKARFKQPLFAFYYFLANHQMEEAHDALLLVLKKYRAPQYQAAYKLAYALGKNDLSSEHESLDQLKHKHLKLYYEGLLAVEIGDLSTAQKKANEATKPWMKEVILAKIQGHQGKKQEELKHMDKAISLTRGLQRFLLIKWKDRP